MLGGEGQKWQLCHLTNLCNCGVEGLFIYLLCHCVHIIGEVVCCNHSALVPQFSLQGQLYYWLLETLIW